MDTPEYKVIITNSDDLEDELNRFARESWRPILLAPKSFGGASFANVGPSRVDSFCVILERS